MPNTCLSAKVQPWLSFPWLRETRAMIVMAPMAVRAKPHISLWNTQRQGEAGGSEGGIGRWSSRGVRERLLVFRIMTVICPLADMMCERAGY